MIPRGNSHAGAVTASTAPPRHHTQEAQAARSLATPCPTRSDLRDLDVAMFTERQLSNPTVYLPTSAATLRDRRRTSARLFPSAFRMVPAGAEQAFALNRGRSKTPLRTRGASRHSPSIFMTGFLAEVADA